MRLDEIQNALFAAYDIRNAITEADRSVRTEGESVGASLDLIIETLEILETEMEGETT